MRERFYSFSPRNNLLKEVIQQAYTEPKSDFQSLPPSDPETCTLLHPQTSVPGMLGTAVASFLCHLNRHPIAPSPVEAAWPWASSDALCRDPTLEQLRNSLRASSYRGHSASSLSCLAAAATKTRRRGTCALGTGAMLAAELGMLSCLRWSGGSRGKGSGLEIS